MKNLLISKSFSYEIVDFTLLSRNHLVFYHNNETISSLHLKSFKNLPKDELKSLFPL